MSSNLRESMRPALEEVCVREGIPDLLDKIVDETMATSVEELLPLLEANGHPALTMDPLF
jgi:CO dehydrogenase/acetyl-CoA synthase beta subunit